MTDPALPNAVARKADGLPRRAKKAPVKGSEREALDRQGDALVAHVVNMAVVVLARAIDAFIAKCLLAVRPAPLAGAEPRSLSGLR